MAAVYKTISSNHKSEKNSHGCGPGSGAGWLILWVAPHSSSNTLGSTLLLLLARPLSTMGQNQILTFFKGHAHVGGIFQINSNTYIFFLFDFFFWPYCVLQLAGVAIIND